MTQQAYYDAKRPPPKGRPPLATKMRRRRKTRTRARHHAQVRPRKLAKDPPVSQNGRTPLVMEQTHAGEGHGDAVLVGHLDDVVVADGAPGLGDVLHA